MIHFKKEVDGDRIKLMAFDDDKYITSKYIYRQKNGQEKIEHELFSFYKRIKYDRGELNDMKLTKLVKDW